MLKAVIFDMNGVIIDIEPMNVILRTDGHIIVPYVIELIKDLYKNGIKLYIASSSSNKEIEEVMDILDIRQYFNGYVSEPSVAHTKPAPDIFLETVKRLGVNPDECFIIEDSFYGVTAACAAEIPCIGFVNPNSGNQDLSNASLLIEGFDEVDYYFLNQFYLDMYSPITILTSDEFIIRELTTSDFPDLFQIYLQPEIRAFLEDFTNDYHIELEKHKAYIQNVYRFYGYGLWGVFLKEKGQLIGRCGIELKTLNNKEIYEIGYLLSSVYQGQGYAKNFVTDVINYCFSNLDISHIVAVIEIDNIRSIHLAEQIGFKRYGECQRNYHNCYIYEIND